MENKIPDISSGSPNISPQEPDSQKGNLFTKLFQQGKKEDASIIDTIVKQKEEKEEERKKAEAEEAEKKKKEQTTPVYGGFGQTPQSSELAKEEPIGRQWAFLFLQFSVFLLFVSGIGYFAMFDTQNSLLGMVNISNVGAEWEQAKNDKEVLEEEIVKINKEIADIEANYGLNNIVKTLQDAQKKRMNWTDILDEIKVVLADVPQDYVDDMTYISFMGDLAKQQITISAGLKNEKVMTLAANIVDAFEDSENFYNVDFKKYMKNKFQDPDDPTNRDYTAGAQLIFQFKTPGAALEQQQKQPVNK